MEPPLASAKIRGINKAIKRHAFLLKLLISIALLIYCSMLIDFERLQVLELQWGWFGLAWLLIQVDYVVGAMRFKALADIVAPMNLYIHIKYYFWGGFFNSALPGSIGGDAMRILWLNKHDMDAKSAMSLVLVERILGVLTLILVAGFGAAMIEIPSELQPVVTDLRIWAGVGVFGIFAFGLVLKETRLIQQIMNTIRHALCQLGTARCFRILMLSLAYQIITVTITICIANGIGLEIGAAIWFFIVPLVWLLTVIPISIGGLGVREVGFVYLLGAFGSFAEQAVLLGLLCFLVYLIGGLVGGGWYIYDGKATSK